MPTTPAVLATAISALSNGACPIRGMTDGSKRPLGNWSEWQQHRPNSMLLTQWFSGGHPALGIVCGEVSGRLECLEIEGRAMKPLWVPLKERLAQAGLLDLLTDIAAGYAERSPSDGVHFLYRIDGESEMPGNTKLASRVVTGVVQIESMIETRGEGGFIMVAPSNGSTHPSGKPWLMLSGGWDSVTTITRDQRDALIGICESFDEAPVLVVPPPSRSRAGTQPREGSGWVETALGDWLQANPIESVLQHHGWQYLESDSLGQLWRRPGKDRGSCSARVNLNSRLHVFSTSTPFVAGMRRATTYDSLDVELTYRLGRPPSSDERVALLRAETTAAPPTDDWSFVGRAAGSAGVQHHQEGVVESIAIPNLPREFWLQRPWLTQIRDAAHSRLRSPDGLLGAVLARYATTIPKTLMLPEIVGEMATFDFMSMLVAPSGGGKSSTMALARRMMGSYPANPRILWDAPIGSGEGLVQAFFELREMEVDGRKIKQQVQIYDALHLSVDEGSVLSAQGNRDGTTIVPILCSAWSGTTMGQLNARQETKRLVKAGEARVTAVMGIQTALGEQLTALVNTGLPQRMVWFSLADPNAPPPGSVTYPGELDVHYLDPNSWSIRQTIRVHRSILEEIQDREHRRLTGTATEDPLDAHRYLAMLKTAGVFMFMDERREISPEDWELSRSVVDTSRQVRSTIIETTKLAKRKVFDDQVRARVGVTLAIEDASRARAVDLGARAIARCVVRADGPVKRRELSIAVSGRHKKLATLDEMLDYAIGRGWVVDNSNRTYVPGDSVPAM